MFLASSDTIGSFWAKHKEAKTYKDINAPKFFDGLVDGTLNLLFIANIANDGKRYLVGKWNQMVRLDDRSRLNRSSFQSPHKLIFEPLPPAFSISSAAVYMVPGSYQVGAGRVNNW